MAIKLQQRQLQKQVQVLGQKQIRSLNILSMSTQDLVAELRKNAEENPSLIIDDSSSRINGFYDGTRISSSSAEGEIASEKHLAALESQADNRTSLTEHFLSQLNMLKIPPAEHELCEKLIYNLDSKGFHFLAPVSLLDKKNKAHTIGLLEKCMERIQQFDPPGLCVKNMEESLFVQAKQNPNASPLALFILDGKLNFLNPPKTDRIISKIKKHLDEQKKMFGLNENSLRYTNFTLTEREVEKAVAFIRTLEPFPAREFSTTETHFVSADVFAEKVTPDSEETPADGILIKDGDFWINVRMSMESIPKLSVNEDDFKILDSEGIGESKKKELAQKIQKAQEIIEAINYRQNTILRACCEIVRIQIDFFKKGPGHLVPLKLQDIADKLGIHETTVSRMANSKFLRCEWGLFNIKYFFTNSASTKTEGVSRDMVMHHMKRIIEANCEGKKLSDQKIVEKLEERGIKISRRTVAKYRSLLNIDSSYNR